MWGPRQRFYLSTDFCETCFIWHKIENKNFLFKDFFEYRLSIFLFIYSSIFKRLEVNNQ